MRRIAAPLLLLAGLGISACFSAPDEISQGLLRERTPEAREMRPLGGEALAQRKQELVRAHDDLVKFRTTLVSLHHRKERNAFVLFKQFVDSYMGTHLEKLLESEWQSHHPELMGLDANVRLVQAEVLMLMRDPHRMQRVLDEVERRFAGRESMLVDYPVGEQSSLGEALELLRHRKWRG